MNTSSTSTTTTTQHNDKSQPKQKSRKSLNQQQIEVLQILYKFRFANVKLISQYQNQTIRNSNVRIKNLFEQEYVGRIYDNTYRINRWPAVYFLLPKAIRLLKTNPDLDKKGLHLLYYNRLATPVFINHCMRLFRVYLKLEELYGNNPEIYMSTELAEQQQFPKLKPDSFISFSGKYSNLPDCMVDLIESNKPSNQIRQLVNRFVYHYENSTWDGDYPHILLICDNSGLEQDVKNMLSRALGYNGMDKPILYTTTLKAILGAKNSKSTIWQSVLDEEERVALH